MCIFVLDESYRKGFFFHFISRQHVDGKIEKIDRENQHESLFALFEELRAADPILQSSLLNYWNAGKNGDKTAIDAAKNLLYQTYQALMHKNPPFGQLLLRIRAQFDCNLA